jgi:aldose 1-epimerase
VTELDTVCLRDERSSLQANFVPGAGMLCCSLRDRDEELLAQNDGVAAYAERGKTMGIPLLYPWANRLEGFQYSVAGRDVTVPHDCGRVALDGNGLPIHGVIGGRMQWELTDGPGGAANRGAGEHRHSLEARISWSRSQSELFEVFPFRHEARYRAHLHDGRLRIEITVHACDQDAVPVAFGFHPYLSLAGAPREQWQIQLPRMRRLALDAQQIPIGPDRTVLAESFELAGRVFDDGFDELAEPARFVAAGGDRRLELDLQAGYPCAQVYAPHASPFICFEPMTAPANALCSHQGLHTLAPGERYSAAFAVRVSRSSAADGRD